ncbi:DUF1611 domain-containing protein [Flavobacteriaceae bacterium]|nr:DUF1611 domain-containing protein [Flavobacteriaceae bacterium]
MLKPEQTIALYMEGHVDSDYGKMGMGVIRYCSNPICCVIDSTQQGNTMDAFMPTKRKIPIVANLEAALEAGAEVLILGIAPSGGKIPETWIPVIEAALQAGLSLVNGLHDLIAPRWGALLQHPQQWIWDVRVPSFVPPIATGRAATCGNRRVLLVGTDMAVGKMTTGLELFSYLKNNGHQVGFVATGQIGITIMGKGIPLDAFKVDHACGAVETAVLEQQEDWVIIEGQGSLLHPGSTATLPLMRGSCPTDLILCHRAGKERLRSPEHIRVPDLKAFIALNEDLCTVVGTFPQAKVRGIAVNTSTLTEADSRDYLAAVSKKTGIVAVDPVRFSIDPLAKALLSA